MFTSLDARRRLIDFVVVVKVLFTCCGLCFVFAVFALWFVCIVEAFSLVFLKVSCLAFVCHGLCVFESFQGASKFAESLYFQLP